MDQTNHSSMSLDFAVKDTWRIFRIMGEFVEGFETLAQIPRAVAVFGSARTLPGSRDYEDAEAMGRALAQAGYAVITGGGPGAWRPRTRGRPPSSGRRVGGSRHRAALGDDPTTTSPPSSPSATSSCAR